MVELREEAYLAWREPLKALIRASDFEVLAIWERSKNIVFPAYVIIETFEVPDSMSLDASFNDIANWVKSVKENENT